MSNLLKEAIVDAQALREAALKNAEAAIVDKYSTEVRETLDQLLEQDELGLEEEAPAEGDASLEEDVEDVPLAATDGLSEMEGDNLNQLAEEGEDVEVNLDLGALKEALQEMSMPSMPSMPSAPGARDDEDEEELDEDIEIEEAILAAMLEEEESISIDDEAEKQEASAEQDEEAMNGMEEELDISDELLDSIVEKLTVDMGAELAGWAGRSSEDQKFQMEKEIAHRRSTDVEEELETLKKAQEELVFENNQLKEQLNNLQRAAIEMKESLQGVNLSNARLLYTNRVLRNASLNERQKDRIVEAISRAGSVTEARTIFDTLQSTVEAKPKKSPQSLSEAVNKTTSTLIMARRNTERQEVRKDPAVDRWKILAGINNSFNTKEES